MNKKDVRQKNQPQKPIITPLAMSLTVLADAIKSISAYVAKKEGENITIK